MCSPSSLRVCFKSGRSFKEFAEEVEEEEEGETKQHLSNLDLRAKWPWLVSHPVAFTDFGCCKI